MEIKLIASTQFHHGVVGETDYKAHKLSESVTHADELAEMAGRNCYESWERPNPKTATNEGYLKNILAQNHTSVLEHSSATFYVKGVSRALLAELSRHRHLSFSVVSQRYVDANTLGDIVPPIVNELNAGDWAIAKSILAVTNYEARVAYDRLVELFVAAGHKRKQAREAARAVLPNSTESPMVVTGNLRAWRDVLGKRFHVAADRELQEFATEILSHLRTIAPNSFQDFPDKLIGSED